MAMALIVIPVIAGVFLAAQYYSQQNSADVGDLSNCENTVNMNGIEYCTLDVTSEMELAIPGYTIMRTPQAFMGVTFETVCPDNGAVNSSTLLRNLKVRTGLRSRQVNIALIA